jgi:hypothetical protein
MNYYDSLNIRFEFGIVKRKTGVIRRLHFMQKKTFEVSLNVIVHHYLEMRQNRVFGVLLCEME